LRANCVNQRAARAISDRKSDFVESGPRARGGSVICERERPKNQSVISFSTPHLPQIGANILAKPIVTPENNLLEPAEKRTKKVALKSGETLIDQNKNIFDSFTIGKHIVTLFVFMQKGVDILLYEKRHHRS
jgi:hypothetical protein